jgi:hypothetical protein
VGAVRRGPHCYPVRKRILVLSLVKPIIIGMAPSKTSDPRQALSGRSGARLAGLCGLSLEEFLDTFERYNLLPGWQGRAGKGDRYLSVPEARAQAERVLEALSGRRVVVLGAINATAFGLRWPKLEFRGFRGGAFAWCPHPSAINLFWNDPANFDAARRFWTELARGSSRG